MMVLRCWMLLLLVAIPAADAAEANLPLVSPVKTLEVSAQPATAQPAMARRMTTQPAAGPTMPGGKLPQYQLGHRQRSVPQEGELQDPRIRFFLVLPEAILLVEAKITIDELPFPAIREQRIQRLIKEATENASESTGGIPVLERLKNSAKISGEVATADEIRWLLCNWSDGPTQLLLNDNFQRFRGHQRPAFAILDRNRDGTVSSEEMKQAVQSFQECDVNRDGIIQFTEITNAAADVRDVPVAPPAPLITLLPTADAADLAFQRLQDVRIQPESTFGISRFDRNGNGTFDTDEMEVLQRTSPDLSLTIAFDTRQQGNSRIAITAVAAELQPASKQAVIDHKGISVPIAGRMVTFSAVQAGTSDQVSVGAVQDGYPILPHLDPNDDGQLTVRELRSLPSRVNAFDKNRDWTLTLDEVVPPVRVCFGLGPTVHRELATIRRVYPESSQRIVEGPEWFVRMDRNKDHDLVRGEFPGTDDQFAELDQDHDELISADEALKFDKKATDAGTDTKDQ